MIGKRDSKFFLALLKTKNPSIVSQENHIKIIKRLENCSDNMRTSIMLYLVGVAFDDILIHTKVSDSHMIKIVEDFGRWYGKYWKITRDMKCFFAHPDLKESILDFLGTESHSELKKIREHEKSKLVNTKLKAETVRIEYSMLPVSEKEKPKEEKPTEIPKQETRDTVSQKRFKEKIKDLLKRTPDKLQKKITEKINNHGRSLIREKEAKKNVHSKDKKT